MKRYSKRTETKGGRRSRRQQRGGQAENAARNLTKNPETKNIEDTITKMKTMSLQELNLAAANGFLKYFIIMSDPVTQREFSGIIQGYFMAISKTFKENTPPEIAAFSKDINPTFALFMLIIDKVAPPSKTPALPSGPTDADISQRLNSFISLLKTITPTEVKAQSEDAKKYMMSFYKQPPEIIQEFQRQFQEKNSQIMTEGRAEVLKITPEQLLSYPIWAGIAKDDMLAMTEDKIINYLMVIGWMKIFKPVIDKIQAPSSSSTVSSSSTIPPTTTAQSTTTAQATIKKSIMATIKPVLGTQKPVTATPKPIAVAQAKPATKAPIQLKSLLRGRR